MKKILNIFSRNTVGARRQKCRRSKS